MSLSHEHAFGIERIGLMDCGMVAQRVVEIARQATGDVIAARRQRLVMLFARCGYG